MEGYRPGEEEAKFSFLDKFRGRVQSKMNESRLPSVDYESTVGVYGGKLKATEDGRIVWNNKGIVSTVDRIGDAILRTFDEHTVKDLGKMWRSRPKNFFRFLAPGAKRYRGNTEEILENIRRLGLQDYYGPSAEGIEIKKRDLYTEGRALQDIYRSDVIGSTELSSIDRFAALAEASKYVRSIHDKHGAIGELLVSDIIFSKQEGAEPSDPVLNLPDIIYNPEKYKDGQRPSSEVGLKEKKATDLLDFLASVAVEELRRSEGDVVSLKKSLQTVVEGYGDGDVVGLVRSLVGRGRLTLQGDTEFLDLPPNLMTKIRPLAAQHNKARTGSKTDVDALIKQSIFEVCSDFYKPPVDQESSPTS